MGVARIAIIGAGVAGKRHMTAIADSTTAKLVAVADPLSAAKTLAQDTGVEWFADADAMLAKMEPDGVIVATPTEHHLAPTLAALDAGAHVLVEKPITATLDEAGQVIARSAGSKCHVLAGHHRRYCGLVDKAREIVRGGKLGRLVAVTGQWNVRKNKAYYEPGWRRKWRAGPILTNLIHDMDALRYICGNVTSIAAETSNHVLELEKEDAAALIIRFENGALGTFILSDQSHSPWSWEQATGENPTFPKSGQNVVRFMGTDASLEFPNLKLWHRDGQPADWNHTLKSEEFHCPPDDAFLKQIDHFAAVTGGSESPRITARDAAGTLRTVLAVYEAAESGKRVQL